MSLFQKLLRVLKKPSVQRAIRRKVIPMAKREYQKRKGRSAR
ncbi:hypothetical protein [Aureibacillus halotolerans]|uniref:Uncharacterized protein n=1 Tax=Aureibacillus halotolerans TaxID=1508390 RepID=A0A4R6TYG1_9BACI|nr:hypothetical protein [Aureibacillus halotolerans]TDQ37433.1 hypothetical protein EV213_11368 [Aureibacillus halotolerans]